VREVAVSTPAAGRATISLLSPLPAEEHHVTALPDDEETEQDAKPSKLEQLRARYPSQRAQA
jgi:hypothetical protein